MNRLAYIIGNCKIKLSGNSKNRLLKYCLNNNLYIKNIFEFKDTVCFITDINGYFKIKDFNKKLLCDIEYSSFKGIISLFEFIKNKYRFIFYYLIIFAMFLYLRNVLFEINITGNSYYTTDYLTEFLKNNNVNILSDLKNIDSFDIKNKIVENNEKIKWASVYKFGNNLNINIEEFSTIDNNNKTIISNVYGTVEEIFVRDGTAMVCIGDEIKPGDVLISNKIEIKNNYDEIITERFVTADGFVKIKYYKDLIISQPFKNTQKIYNGAGKRGLEFTIDNCKLFSYQPSIYGGKYDIISKRMFIDNKILSILNFNINRSYFYEYGFETLNYTYDEAYRILNDKINNIISEYDADNTILNSEVYIESDDYNMIASLHLELEGYAGIIN